MWVAVFSTVSTGLPSRIPHQTRISAPSGEYSAALESRFPTALPRRDGSPVTVTPGVSMDTSRWFRCSSNPASSVSCRSIRADKSTLSCLTATDPVSIREMASISPTRFSIRLVT